MIDAMDHSQILGFLTGSVGAVVALYLWNRSLMQRLEAMEAERLADKKATLELQAQVIHCIADVQKSLEMQVGCKFKSEE